MNQKYSHYRPENDTKITIALHEINKIEKKLKIIIYYKSIYYEIFYLKI